MSMDDRPTENGRALISLLADFVVKVGCDR
jgi:hypothetical protein